MVADQGGQPKRQQDESERQQYFLAETPESRATAKAFLLVWVLAPFRFVADREQERSWEASSNVRQ